MYLFSFFKDYFIILFESNVSILNKNVHTIYEQQSLVFKLHLTIMSNYKRNVWFYRKQHKLYTQMS